MIKKTILWASIHILCSYSLYALHDWTVLNYIEADNNVCLYGLSNIKAMQRVGSNDNVTILVQLDETKQKKTWRFKIVPGGSSEDASLDKDMGLNPEKELPEGVAWALKNYPSKYFMLTLWNHGNGILDEPKGYNIPSRGILYDYANGTYLNNQQLERALQVIHHNVMGKKIPILGMDACLMAMIEVCYQIQDHVNILVASENVEPVPGWDYYSFLKFLTQHATITPQELAEIIVTSYGTFTRHKQRHYTLSAMHLSDTEAVVKNINNVVRELNNLGYHNKHELHDIILQARKAAVEYHDGRYIDIVSFYRNLALLLKQKKSSIKNHNGTIFTLLTSGERLIRKMVFAYSGTRLLPHCAGLSMYYPRSKPIHHSYLITKFAQNSLWLAFIQEHSAS